MGAFLNHQPIMDYSEELGNFLKTLFKDNSVEVELSFIDSYKMNDTGIHITMSRDLRKDWIGEFSLSSYPGNYSILISHDLYIRDAYRRKGIGQFLQGWKKNVAKAYDFHFLRCTTVDVNILENGILEKSGWKRLNNFFNPTTDNNCIEWEFSLPQKG